MASRPERAQPGLPHSDKKVIGLYETPNELADFLVDKMDLSAMTSRKSLKLLDPAVGEGILLKALVSRLISNGLSPSTHVEVACIDVRRDALRMSRQLLSALIEEVDQLDIRLRPFQDDFLHISPLVLGKFDIIIANPPFVRHHILGYKSSEWNKNLKKQFGIRSEIRKNASSWAYFLMKAHMLLREGGEMGFILPRDFLYAKYASKIRDLLVYSYEHIDIFVFTERRFKGVEVAPVILVAKNKVEQSQKQGQVAQLLFHLVEEFSPHDIRNSTVRIEAYIEGEPWHKLYATGPLADTATKMKALGEYAKIRIGTVTGCRDFFTLRESDRTAFGIPLDYLLPSVPGGRSLRGLEYSSQDWKKDVLEDQRAYMLRIHPEELIHPAVQNYVKHGEELKVNLMYHPKRRKPWYFLRPHIPDAFLSYVAGKYPKVAINTAGATSTNTVHHIDFSEKLSDQEIKALVISLYSSPSLLSMESNGRPLSGGALKLEPREAARIKVVDVREEDVVKELSSLWSRFDSMLRKGLVEDVVSCVDEILVSFDTISSQTLRQVKEKLTLLRKIRRQN